MKAMQSAMKGIVGEVQERTVLPKEPVPPTAPLNNTTVGADSAGRTAFPAAVHRKQSKFSLARQGKESTKPVKRVSFGPTTTTTTSPAAVPSSSSSSSLSSSSSSSSHAMPAVSSSNTMSEAESIAAETTAMITSCSGRSLIQTATCSCGVFTEKRRTKSGSSRSRKEKSTASCR
jgi:hypothetical protein